MAVVGPLMSSALSERAMPVLTAVIWLNVLVALGAMFGLAGHYEWRAIGTTMLVTIGCLMVAANAAALERIRLGRLPYVGATLSSLALAVFVVLLWVDSAVDTSRVVRLSSIALTIGLACTCASLLAISPADGIFDRARNLAYVTIAVLAGVNVVALLVDTSSTAGLNAVLSIVLATVTIIVLVGVVLARRSDAGSGHRRRKASMACPSCMAPIAAHVASGPYTCPGCGIGFHLQVTAPRHAQSIG